MPRLEADPKIHSKARIWNKIGERVRRDFFFQAAAGTMPGVSSYIINGFDSAMGNVLKPIWPNDSQYNYLTDYEPLSVVSDNVNDVYNGSGARLVRILGLDRQFELQMEDVTLRGTTPVVTQGEYFRILEAAVIKAGTVNGAAGLITIAGQSSLLLLGSISGAFNKMTNGVFTVPAHTNGYLYNYHFSMGAPKETALGIRTSTPTAENNNWVVPLIDFMYGGDITIELQTPIFLSEKTDVELVAYTVADSTTYITGMAELVLIDEAFEWENVLAQDETYGITK